MGLLALGLLPLVALRRARSSSLAHLDVGPNRSDEARPLGEVQSCDHERSLEQSHVESFRDGALQDLFLDPSGEVLAWADRPEPEGNEVGTEVGLALDAPFAKASPESSPALLDCEGWLDRRARPNVHQRSPVSRCRQPLCDWGGLLYPCGMLDEWRVDGRPTFLVELARDLSCRDLSSEMVASCCDGGDKARRVLGALRRLLDQSSLRSQHFARLRRRRLRL